MVFALGDDPVPSDDAGADDGSRWRWLALTAMLGSAVLRLTSRSAGGWWIFRSQGIRR